MGKENITATREGVLVMNIRKNSLIKITAISFLLTIFWSGAAYAQPNITGFSGSLTHKGALTITGSGLRSCQYVCKKPSGGHPLG